MCVFMAQQAVLSAAGKLKTASPQSSIMLFSVDEKDDEFIVVAQVPKVRYDV